VLNNFAILLSIYVPVWLLFSVYFPCIILIVCDFVSYSYASRRFFRFIMVIFILLCRWTWSYCVFYILLRSAPSLCRLALFNLYNNLYTCFWSFLALFWSVICVITIFLLYEACFWTVLQFIVCLWSLCPKFWVQ